LHSASLITHRDKFIFTVIINIVFVNGSTSHCWALGDFSFSWSYTQPVRLIGQGLSPTQGLCLHTAQHKTEETQTGIEAWSGIRTHNVSVRESEDSPCLKQRGHWSLFSLTYTTNKQTNSVALSLPANYTDWATATFRRNLVPAFVDRGVSRGQRGGSPTDVNLSFLDRSRYLSFKQLLIYSHKGWVHPVPDPLLLRKSGSVGNRTRDLCVSSQELWPLEHRGGALRIEQFHKTGYDRNLQSSVQTWRMGFESNQGYVLSTSRFCPNWLWSPASQEVKRTEHEADIVSPSGGGGEIYINVPCFEAGVSVKVQT
jgi:hypothetical protein